VRSLVAAWQRPFRCGFGTRRFETGPRTRPRSSCSTRNPGAASRLALLAWTGPGLCTVARSAGCAVGDTTTVLRLSTFTYLSSSAAQMVPLHFSFSPLSTPTIPRPLPPSSSPLLLAMTTVRRIRPVGICQFNIFAFGLLARRFRDDKMNTNGAPTLVVWHGCSSPMGLG
jgi:hypothetical protein